jgi:hypothetical protein
VIKPVPSITGPGTCIADDVVQLISVWSHRGDRIRVNPPAMLRCGMAEVLADWVREVSEVARGIGSTMTGISIGTSFDCRGRNRDPNARLSQHGLANAADVVSLQLKASKTLTLTDQTAPMQVRLLLHESACRLFTTVLGPGSDGYHEDHIHLDLAERRSGYRICQWDVRDDGRQHSH